MFMAKTFEFKAIQGRTKKGGSFLNVKGLSRDLRAAREETAALVRGDLEKSVKDWDKKPKFIVKSLIRADESIISIFTDNELYIMLNNGTRPHIIRPKNARMLYFKDAYNAKTIPNVLESRPGGTPNGAGDVFAKEVHHPGTKARRWFWTISRLRQKDFQQRVDKALGKL
jgi:hypothetical protein